MADAMYHRGAWECYRRDVAMIARGDIIGGHGAYLPNPDILWQRAADVRWLTAAGFSDYFATSVMVWCSPDIGVVRRMHARYGLEETVRRCDPYLVGHDGYECEECI